MLQSPRGTKDILPQEINLWHFVENVFRQSSKKFAYKELRTPIFEHTEVFSRSIGDSTDIVNKEMYTFPDKGDKKSLSLRPEMTAALIRSVIQHKLTSRGELKRLWYYGPFFRYERPQAGRYRQFHQYGAECLSSPYPESDVEILCLADNIIKSCKISDYTLFINSLGNKSSRENYKKTLIEYLKDNFDKLSEDSKNRLEINPLRVLDSKDADDIQITTDAPKLIDYLDDESNEHFSRVKLLLDEIGIKYELNSKLVRGLDYYSHTVFEFQSNHLGAQSSFGGGGRYNDLYKQLGGQDNPAVGFAFGVERLIMIIESLSIEILDDSQLDYYVIIQDKKYINEAFRMANYIRSKGYSAVCDIQNKSFKSQFKESNNFNAKYTLIIAEQEFSENSILVKDMNSGNQEKILINDFLK